jgi:conjugal transfer pilus assembly protein TraA
MAFAAFLFGAGYGVANQTIVPAILGIVFALVFAIGPGVIEGMMTALV